MATQQRSARARVRPVPWTRRTPRRRAALLALAVALFAVGCGDSSDDDLASSAVENGAIDDDLTESELIEDGIIDGESSRDGEPAGDDGSGTDISGSENSESVQREPEATVEPAELPAVSVPDLTDPEDLLPELRIEVGDALQDAAESPSVDILDVADLPDTDPTDEEVASFGDGHSRTPSGRLIVLDEVASLACANVEIALGAIDEGKIPSAKEHIATAGERAGRSELETVENWSDALDEAASGDSIDATTLVGFLSVCIEGGYVI